MKIGQVSKLLNISISSLRYYDKLGLVSPIKNGYSRDYQEKDLERLRFVLILQAANFSLKDINTLIEFDHKYEDLESILTMPKEDKTKLSKLINDNLENVESQLVHLQETKDLLSNMKEKISTIKGE